MSLINITIGIVSTGVRTGLNAIRNQFGSFRKAINSEFAQVASFGAIVAGIVGTFKKAIGSAAQMEGFKASFGTLLGSADAAEKRLEELSRFAAETPFELPEVVEASRVLQTLTDGVLATGDGLRMVGDMAALTGEPVKELSVHVGRLYSGLMNGRAVGESMARLQELGLLSDKTRTKLEDLQREGARGPEVWKIAADSFGKFSGEMERRSSTLEGMWSNLQDEISSLFREFGQPIVDNIKPMIQDWISFAGTAVGVARGLGNAVVWVMNSIRTMGAVGGMVFGLIYEEITLTISKFQHLGIAIAGAWDALKRGDISGMKQAFAEAGKQFVGVMETTRANQLTLIKAFKDEYDRIWEDPVKPKVEDPTQLTPSDSGEIEESRKMKSLREEIAKLEKQHQLDQLEGEAKINALIQERQRILAGANDETIAGLEATKEAMRLQKQIDEEKDKYAKKILAAQQKEGEAQEKLAMSRMTTEEKREYLTQKRISFEEQAREADKRGELEKAAELRAEAYDLQQDIESMKPKVDVQAGQLARIGGGGGAYLTRAEDANKRTAKATEDATRVLRDSKLVLDKIERKIGKATWNP